MTESHVPDFVCPTCQQAVEREPGSEHGICAGCSQSWPLTGHLCAVCGTYQHEESAVCSGCGYALSRICPACRARNWTGDDLCRKCHQPLSLLDILPQTNARATASRLNEQMKEATRSKVAEARDSARRMKELEAIEDQRLASLQAYQQQKANRERRMLLTAVVLALVVLMALLLYGLLVTV